jgi:hypothetical protein
MVVVVAVYRRPSSKLSPVKSNERTNSRSTASANGFLPSPYRISTQTDKWQRKRESDALAA